MTSFYSNHLRHHLRLYILYLMPLNDLICRDNLSLISVRFLLIRMLDLIEYPIKFKTENVVILIRINVQYEKLDKNTSELTHQTN